MQDIISDISSIVTCVTFILYMSGRVFVLSQNRHTIYEKFTIIPYDSDFVIENEETTLIVDQNGCEFTLESEYGIKEIEIYKVVYEIINGGILRLNSRTLTSTFRNRNSKKEKLYIKCDLGEHIPTTQFEITRTDYAIITFDIYQSGKDGHIIACNYKYKMTFRSFLYHLCI